MRSADLDELPDDGRYVEAGRAEGDAELELTSPYPIVVNPARLTD